MTAEKQKEDFCHYDCLFVCFGTGHLPNLPILINYKDLPRLKVANDVVHLGEST